MPREAQVRKRCIELANSIAFDAETDSGEHMAAYVGLAQTEKWFGWSEDNAAKSYRWCVRNGHFKGNIVSRDQYRKAGARAPNRSAQKRSRAGRAEIMNSHPLNEARAELSKLVDQALAGEPQRVTRYRKEAVIIVSEKAWNARSKSAPTLGALLADFATGQVEDGDITGRPWKERELGADVE